MIIYGFYDPDFEDGPIGDLIRVWDTHWRSQGWQPMILPARLAGKCPDLSYEDRAKKALAKAKKKGDLISFRSFHIKGSLFTFPKTATVDQIYAALEE